MKKIFFLLLTIVLCINICACSTEVAPPQHYDYPERTYQMANRNGYDNVTIEIKNNIFEIKSPRGGSSHGIVSERINEIVLSSEDGSGSIYVFDKETDNTLRFNSEKSTSYNGYHYIPDNTQFIKNP